MGNYREKIKIWLDSCRQKRIILNYTRILEDNNVCEISAIENKNQENNFFNLDFLMYFCLYKRLTTEYEHKKCCPVKGQELLCEKFQRVTVGGLFAKKNECNPAYTDKTQFVEQVNDLINAIILDHKFYQLLPLLNDMPISLQKNDNILVSLGEYYNEADTNNEDDNDEAECSNGHTINGYKKRSKYDIAQIITGIYAVLTEIGHNQSKFEIVNPIHLVPLWIFISMNLPKNELPSLKHQIVEDKGVTYMQGLIKQVPYSWGYDVSAGTKATTDLEKELEKLQNIRDRFLLVEIESPHVRVFAARDGGTEKYRKKFEKRKRKSDVARFGKNSFGLGPDDPKDWFDYFYEQFALRDLNEKQESLVSLAVFQEIMDKTKIETAKELNFLSGSNTWPINETVNIIAFDLLTGLVTVLDSVLEMSNCIVRNQIVLSKTRWLLMDWKWQLSQDECKLFDEMILNNGDKDNNISMKDFCKIDPLKEYLSWQRKKVDEWNRVNKKRPIAPMQH